MSIIIKSGNSADTVDTDGAGNFQVNVKSPVDSAGNVLVSAEGRKATYRAVYEGAVFAANGQCVWQMTGSGTKKVKVNRIALCGELATAGNIRYQLQKASSANTGGTPSAVTKIPLDSSDAAATATVNAYTAAPTIGTVIGTLTSVLLLLNAPATVQDTDRSATLFAATPGAKPLILNSTSEALIIIQQPGATSLTGLFLVIEVEWTEE